MVFSTATLLIYWAGYFIVCEGGRVGGGGGCCPALYPGRYSLDAGSTFLPIPSDSKKMSPDVVKCPLGD